MDNGIILKNVSFAYNHSSVLRNINLEIHRGEFLGIIGLNGSGKTTLTYLLNGLIPHVIKGNLTGSVLVDGFDTKAKDITFLTKNVGMVFQNPDFSLFNLTVKEEILFGLKNFGLNTSDENIKKALQVVGLENFHDRDPQSLSFGEKQKVNLASVLALDTPYMVLDEPSAMLDYQSSQELYEILLRLNKKGKTIIVVEHDTDLLWMYAQNIMVLDKGTCLLRGDTEKSLLEKEVLTKLGIKFPNINFKRKNNVKRNN